MNKKLVYTITVAIAVSTASVFAADEAATKTLEERIAALEGATKASSWADNVKIKADLRYRFEQIREDGDTTKKNRQRIRARIGAYADVNDFTTAGIRIRTGKDANSGNQTIGDHFNNKGVYLDLAYVTTAPEDGKYGAATLGKMKYPWKVTTDMIWDSDVNPEGVAYTYATKLKATSLFASTGYFKVEETSSTHDLNLASAQIGLTQQLCEKSKLTLGASLFDYDNIEDLVDPDTISNSNPDDDNYAVDYQVAEGFAELGVKKVLPIAFKLYGNYVNNLEESSENEGFCGGIKFGDAKKGKWEAKVGYRELQANATPAYFADSDYAGGGTDIKGTRVKAKYNLCKNLQFGATYIAGEKISDSKDVNTLHLDLIAKF